MPQQYDGDDKDKDKWDKGDDEWDKGDNNDNEEVGGHDEGC